jgi:hypothetical protein
LIIAAVLLNAGKLVEIAGASFPAADLASKTAWLNGLIDWTIIAAAAITIFDAVGEIRRLLRGRRAKLAAIPTT